MTQDPREKADQQFLHGLLRFRAEDRPAVQEERVRRVLRSIAPRRRAALWPMIAAAASILLFVAIVTIVTSGEGAYAFMESAMAASRRNEPRRYVVHGYLHALPDVAVMDGQVDSEGPSRAFIRLSAFGYSVMAGRDGEAEWILDPHRGEQSFDPRHWPRWLSLDHAAILVRPLDEFLDHLRQVFELELHGKERLADYEGLTFRRLVASGRRASDPERIELWIEERSRIVYRVEVRWPRQASAIPPEAPRDIPAHEVGHAPLGAHPPPARLTLELARVSGFPSDWFRATAHQ